MTTEQILILAIIQGITEFLPVSSSAHLVLVPLLTDFPDQGVVFDVALHTGTLLAVMLYFHKAVASMTKGGVDVLTGRMTTDNAKLFGLLVMATIPVAIAGYFLKDFVAGGARSFTVIGITSIVFGVLLWVSDLFPRYQHNLKQVSWLHALFFGLFQMLAIIPGTSRSGITMTAGRFLGFKRKDAAEFSMLMAIPVLVMTGVYTTMNSLGADINWQTAGHEMLLGLGISFASAFVAISLLMRLVGKLGFGPFVFYRIMLGSALLVLAA